MHSSEQGKLLLAAANRYADRIDERTLKYLEGRGISEEVAALFSLGTVTDPHAGHEMHAGWLSIPYITAMGMCVGFKFRRLDDGKPKYGSPLGQTSHLYNVSDITKRSARIVVTEGELDAVIVSGVLNLPAVGCPGVAAWKPHYARLLNGYDTVYVAGDNDVKEDGSNPGAEFSRRVASEVMNATIVNLPQGLDITDYYLQNGYDKTRRLLGVQGELSTEPEEELLSTGREPEFPF
jgi:DNA primase